LDRSYQDNSINASQALIERIKELNCLYTLSQLLADSRTVEEAVRAVLQTLPPAFQFPDSAISRVLIDGRVYSSREEWFPDRSIRCKLTIEGREAGCAEVSYSPAGSGRSLEFLPEEEKLLATVARDLGSTIERVEFFNELTESKERLSFAIEASREGVWDWNVETGEVYFSPRWKEMLGYSDSEIENRLDEWESRVFPGDLEKVERELQRCLNGEIPYYEAEHRVMTKDGSYKWILDRGKVVLRDAQGRALRMVGTHTDLTEHHRIEEELRRYNRALSFLSEVNQFLVRVTDEEELLKGTCDIATKFGGYALAWIAYKVPSRSDLKPVVSSGLASTYPGKISVTFDESELGRSAVGTAVRTGTTIIKSSIDKSLEYSPWKNMIDSYGLKSAISLPLKIEGETIGALNIYSSDENAFDQEEVHLLEELSGDLSYGILSLRNRKKLEHLNRVLLSIRSINQLIVREEDRGTLIRKITDLLAGLRSYDKSLLVILDENMKVVDWSSSGFEGAKLEKVETALRENLLPPFLTRVLTSEEVLMIPNEEYRRSNLSGDDQTGHAVLLKSLKSSDRISGFIAAIMPENFSQDLEERSLFGEIANDIALAISKIELKNERESLQERFALFMDKFPGAVFMQDRDLRLSYFNKYMEKYFGIDSHWLGKSADQFLSGEWGRSMLRDARKVRPGESISEELTARCTDGRDRIFFVQKFPISSGSDTSMIGGIALDITDRKLSETMATRLGMVLDWSVNEIFVFDHETLRFLLANRGAIENTGYSMDELKEMTPLDLKKETSPAEFKKITEYLKNGKNRSVVFETVHTRKNGSKYPVEVRLQLHDDNMGKVFVAVIVDITERKKAEDSVRRSLESLIKTLSVLVESRDPYTYGHQKRVSELATAIAARLFADDTQGKDKIESVRVAALLHDIGKNAVPTEILTKPIQLNKIEFELVREHARQGYEILKDVYFPWPIAEIVRQHHERLDGSGYPDKLTGDSICLEARIIAVADVVEAMSSHRPYRAALGIDAALEEIRKNAGRLYDTTIVKACLEVFKEGFEFSD